MWWRWSTEPEFMRRNFLKAVAGMALLFWGGFAAFVWGGLGPDQNIIDLSDGIHEGRVVLQDFFDFWVAHPVLGTILLAALVLIFGGVVRRRRGRP